MKFSTKLTVLYLGTILSILVPVLLFFQQQVLEHVEQQVVVNLQEQAENTIDKVDRFLFERIGDIQIIASDAVLLKTNSTLSEVTRRLIDYRNTYAVYLTLSLINKEHVVVADTEGLVGNTVTSLKNSWQKLQQGETVIVIGFSETLRKKVIYIASPLKKSARGSGCTYFRRNALLHSWRNSESEGLHWSRTVR
jgi:hypothetical protein